MPEYKLLYFDARGRGEFIRYLFHLAGQKFVDERFEGTKWPEIKPTTLFGIVPQLTVDGKVICQTGAIERYLAKEFGFMGKSKTDEVDIDMLMGCAGDVVEALGKIYFEKDETKKNELKKAYETSLPDRLKWFESYLKGDWFVGGTVTLADVHVYHCFFLMLEVIPSALDKFPKLKAHSKRFEELPKIAAYLAKRPMKQTDPAK